MKVLEKLMDIHFNGQIEIIQSKRLEREEYDIQYSKILQDYYWNYAFLKSTDANLKPIWEKIVSEMKNLKRQPVLYIMSCFDNANVKQQLKNCHLEKLYTDVWMVVEELENFKLYESKIEVEFSNVKPEEKHTFVQAVMDGFSSDDLADPYGTLPEEYRTIYDMEFDRKGNYCTIEYCGKCHKEMIATANVWYKEDCAIIYSVSTKKEFRKQGVCKKLMSYIINDLRKKGIKTVCVQTEKGFYTEKVYQSMGFREAVLGEVYG